MLSLMPPCSCCTEHRPHARKSRLRKGLAWAQCLVPGFLLALVPKCPLCIVAYAAMFTGLGMSFSTAAYLRIGMIVVCVVALVYLVGRQYVKMRR